MARLNQYQLHILNGLTHLSCKTIGSTNIIKTYSYLHIKNMSLQKRNISHGQSYASKHHRALQIFIILRKAQRPWLMVGFIEVANHTFI